MARPDDYPEWASDGDNLLEPASGKKAAGWIPGEEPPAHYFNWWKRLVWQWVQYLDTEKLPAVTQLASSTPVFGSPNTAHDHPSSAANKWKLQLQMKLHDNTFVRLYSGDGTGGAGGFWILTYNAVWDVSSGGQAWSKDDTGKASYALWANGSGLNWFEKSSGAGTWTSSWTAAVGNAAIGGSLAIGNDLSVTDDATVGGDLGVTGNAAIPNVSGNVNIAGNADIGGSLDVGGDFFAGDDVIAGDEFQYEAPLPTRTTILELRSGTGDAFVFIDGASGWKSVQIGATVWFPIPLPAGATLQRIDVMHLQASSAVDTMAFHVHEPNWSSPGSPFHWAVNSDAVPGASGFHVTAIHPLDGSDPLVIDPANDYSLHWTAGAVDNYCLAVRLVWLDPGPRNH